MKKNTLLNSEISYAIAKMGHFDTLTIADTGLPIPLGVDRIDLAVTKGVPDFKSVFYPVLSELKVQKAILAQEIKTANKELYEELCRFCKQESIEVELYPHEEFKLLTKNSVAVIRTGECSAYANIILESGVTF